MITTILREASANQLTAARYFTADCLHIPYGDVSGLVAVAYICRHFEQGDYSGWDGWVAMREADAR